jgi:nucleotide-binding universal stress UspA family protein
MSANKGQQKRRKGRLSGGLHPRCILALIDLSADSEEVVDCALQYGEMHGASVHLMHVVERASFISGMDNVLLALSDQQMAEQASADLLTMMDRGDGGTMEAKPLVRAGVPEEEIMAAAEELGVDLIILPADRSKGLTGKWGRGTAEKVVRKARCPVLVLQQGN